MGESTKYSLTRPRRFVKKGHVRNVPASAKRNSGQSQEVNLDLLIAPTSTPTPKLTLAYEVRVYVPHGYYAYQVDTMERALNHAHQIMASGVYRRATQDKTVEFHKPLYVRVVGEHLASQYLDTFHRT